MLTDVVDRDLPSGVAMAHIALRTIFPTVNIGVAVLTLISDLGEHQVGMTILTTNFLVQSPQREPCLAVIELQNIA